MILLGYNTHIILQKCINCSESCKIQFLFVWRGLLGLAFGLGNGIIALFITEIAPLKFRGVCGTTMQVGFGFGDMTALIFTLPEVLGTSKMWPIAIALVPAVLAMTQVVVLLFVPESLCN